jgi:hypothetical protein
LTATLHHFEVGGPAARDGAWRLALQRDPIERNEQKERTMKLTSAQVERTLSQFEGQALPDSHPMVPQLSELFGDHTFFLDSNGLNIVEPAGEDSQAGVQAGRVVNLANWSDANLTSLSPHEPEPTDAIVELGSKH